MDGHIYVHYTLQPVKHLCVLSLNHTHGSADSLECNLIELYIPKLNQVNIAECNGILTQPTMTEAKCKSGQVKLSACVQPH